MVVIFVVLLAAVGQLFLSDALRGRDSELARLNVRITALADMLAMQTATSEQLSADLALRTASLKTGAGPGKRNSAEPLSSSRNNFNSSTSKLDQQASELATLMQTRQQLSAELEALQALQDELTAQLQQMNAENATVNEQLRKQGEMNLKAAAEVARLNQQLAQLQQQLTQLHHALDISRDELELKQHEIDQLGTRLNLALADKTAELQRYRSEFFGQLRTSLADYPGVHIEGDRFVLPAAILFESASDELGPQGRRQIAALAASLHDIAARIPAGIPWLLRIDGHTDKQPIQTGRFPSNWETIQRARNHHCTYPDQGRYCTDPSCCHRLC